MSEKNEQTKNEQPPDKSKLWYVLKLIRAGNRRFNRTHDRTKKDWKIKRNNQLQKKLCLQPSQGCTDKHKNNSLVSAIWDGQFVEQFLKIGDVEIKKKEVPFM